MSDFNPTVSDAAADPKKVSHSFFGAKMRFVSVSVTSPILGVLNYEKKIDGAQTAFWTFLGF
jgi:hypothetical protein